MCSVASDGASNRTVRPGGRERAATEEGPGQRPARHDPSLVPPLYAGRQASCKEGSAFADLAEAVRNSCSRSLTGRSCWCWSEAGTQGR
jgi:hypothetical protein